MQEDLAAQMTEPQRQSDILVERDRMLAGIDEAVALLSRLQIAVASTAPFSPDLDQAINALDRDTAALCAVAEHAAEAAFERGNEIDATLAEIRRVRAQSAAA